MDLRENQYINFPIKLEQYLMEGTYRKVEEVSVTFPLPRQPLTCPCSLALSLSSIFLRTSLFSSPRLLSYGDNRHASIFAHEKATVIFQDLIFQRTGVGNFG